MAKALVVGVVVIGGGITVIVLAWRLLLGGYKFGFRIPRLGVTAAGLRNATEARETAESFLDERTEVNWEEQ